MAEMAIYAKVFGLAIDENGKPDYAEVRIGLGGVPDENVVPYEKLCKSLDMNALAKMLGMKIKAEDITIITPEEFYKDYADDGDDDDYDFDDFDDEDEVWE